MQFIEATCVYRAPEQDPPGERSEKRLINLDDVRLITPTADGKGRSVLHMRDGHTPYLIVLEPYHYWQAILTADQPRFS